MSSTLRRLGATALLTSGLLLGPVLSASAHVTVTPSSTASGSYTVLTFSNGHGCEGSPTTEIAIRIPDGIFSVTPTVKPGWDIEKVMQTLDEPVDNGHGGQYTERVAEVVYRAQTPQEDGYREAFELQLKLPEAEAGTRLDFPTVQTCVEGETGWIQLQEEGQPEPPSPAPGFVLTAGGGDGHGAAQAAEGEDSGDGTTLGWIGVGLGGLGLLAGLAAFVRAGRVRTSP